MFYVYILNSLTVKDRMYVGRTRDLENRLKEHNAGESIHTNKYVPWKLVTYLAFDQKEKAVDFGLAQAGYLPRDTFEDWALFIVVQ